MPDLCLGNATKGNLDLNLLSLKKGHECPLVAASDNCRPCATAEFSALLILISVYNLNFRSFVIPFTTTVVCDVFGNIIHCSFLYFILYFRSRLDNI